MTDFILRIRTLVIARYCQKFYKFIESIVIIRYTCIFYCSVQLRLNYARQKNKQTKNKEKQLSENRLNQFHYSRFFFLSQHSR